MDIFYRIRRKMQIIAFDSFGPETMSKIYFRIVLKRKLNLEAPQTFNEKIQWYKLFYCPKDPKIILCADKYKVREYLKNKCLSQYGVPLLGIWNDPKEINWDSLPDKFVIKASHGCAYNIFCYDKQTFSFTDAERKLKKWIKEDFGKFNAEPHYSRIKPTIICEEFLSDRNSVYLTDYKVHCFNGKPTFTLVCSDRRGNSAYYDYYDNNWNRLDYSKTKRKEFEKPLSFEEMIKVSRIIAVDFPFVRVDFYETPKGLFISELTFDPAGGLDNTLTRDADLEIGKLFSLPM